MKVGQVNKLYTKLTPHELAALAFEASVKNDIADMNSIVSAVARHEYRMLDHEYMRRANGFVYLAWFYRGEYWKNLATGYAICLTDSSDKLADQFAAKLAAMDEALDQTCKQLNVDTQAVRKIAECLEEIEPIPQGENHVELVKAYAEQFISLF
jgi:hypothetical protein